MKSLSKKKYIKKSSKVPSRYKNKLYMFYELVEGNYRKWLGVKYYGHEDKEQAND